MVARRRWLDRVPRRRPVEVVRDELEESAPAKGEEDAIPTVLHVPVRCPRCQADRPKNNGVQYRGRGGWKTTYHICRACHLRFKSREVETGG